MSEDHPKEAPDISASFPLVQHRSFRLTPSQPLSWSQIVSLLRMEIPADFRTFTLSFLIGSVLSVPIGLVFALTVRPFEPPQWIGPFYIGAVTGSFVLLPLWSQFFLPHHPVLHRLGMTTFQVGLLYFVVGLFFPAI